MAPTWFDGIPWQIGSSNDLGRPQLGISPLYWCGHLPLPQSPRVAVVGSRAATADQRRAARQIAEGLVRAGAQVWSGGALGIDSEALIAAVAAGGVAVAVLPCAHDSPYPPGTEPTLAAVAQAGGVLSAYAPGTRARIPQFFARNALLVQMVDAVVIVCAEDRGGTMDTARKAWRARLPVAVVPWPADGVNAGGANRLIAAGADCLADPASCAVFVRRVVAGTGVGDRRDVRALGPLSPRTRTRPIDAGPRASPCYAAPGPPRPLPAAPGWSAEETAMVAAALSAPDTEGAGLEDLALATGVERGRLANLLLLAAMAGAVDRLPGGRWRRSA